MTFAKARSRGWTRWPAARRARRHEDLPSDVARTSRGPHRAKELHTAVDRVSFRVAPGEIYGLIGANGSGKSTLIRVLSTLLVPDAGEVSVFGRDAVRAPLSVRPLLNRVSADPSFFRAMSPLENLLSTDGPTGSRGRSSGPAARRSSIVSVSRRVASGSPCCTCLGVSNRRWRWHGPS